MTVSSVAAQTEAKKPSPKDTTAARKASATGTASAKTAPASTVRPAAAQLAYQFTAGESRDYKVIAYFNGHIPPFSQPGSQPLHLKADLVYTMTPKKVDAKGATVDFIVKTAELSLLTKDPSSGEKIDPENDVAPFPIALEDIQKALNVTATLRPDGSVVNIDQAAPSNVKIELGFDLRKLFLIMMPVTFSGKPVQAGSEWTYDDGFLGKNPGKVNYTGRLIGGGPLYRVGESANASVSGSRDKAGHATSDPAQAFETTTGTVTIKGEMKFAAQGKAGAARTGRLKTGWLKMDVLLTTKRKEMDPDRPELPLESQIDVKANMEVQEIGKAGNREQGTGDSKKKTSAGAKDKMP